MMEKEKRKEEIESWRGGGGGGGGGGQGGSWGGDGNLLLKWLIFWQLPPMPNRSRLTGMRLKMIIINAFLIRQIVHDYTRVVLKVLYTKHYNNTQPIVIMGYISHTLQQYTTHCNNGLHISYKICKYRLSSVRFESQ